MKHQHIYDKFEEMFNKLAQEAENWYRKGPNCILVRIPDKGDYIFTYNDAVSWKLEGPDTYLCSGIYKSGKE